MREKRWITHSFRTEESRIAGTVWERCDGAVYGRLDVNDSPHSSLLVLSVAFAEESYQHTIQGRQVDELAQAEILIWTPPL